MEELADGSIGVDMFINDSVISGHGKSRRRGVSTPLVVRLSHWTGEPTLLYTAADNIVVRSIGGAHLATVLHFHEIHYSLGIYQEATPVSSLFSDREYKAYYQKSKTPPYGLLAHLQTKPHAGRGEGRARNQENQL